ncbi:uncharacterized protein BO72DRAFT_449823 [Aspergillus fijiensis CBS 313.89]|uniref:Uncharacterized protein n=1 Tax=Aspergillus fijiensis CBS 313.89 TaxID=1448319 RepID=A0A8G1VXI9_9EURO|nr:uncharacterized protein BO72DRAFT_449823 [Aspergillus fijiensis CBS 313.89]RAK75438.1 hypothetical protein BO72DRAFT_449823 [Aspergillus fijiensis CBS 313.89]
MHGSAQLLPVVNKRKNKTLLLLCLSSRWLTRCVVKGLRQPRNDRGVDWLAAIMMALGENSSNGHRRLSDSRVRLLQWFC